jgi:hypothetical protein
MGGVLECLYMAVVLEILLLAAGESKHHWTVFFVSSEAKV